MKEKLLLACCAIAWLSTFELARRAKGDRRKAECLMGMAVMRNDEAIDAQRVARSILQESL